MAFDRGRGRAAHVAVRPIEFRHDIQILRAVAVLAVLLFHLGVPSFANGFLGVDIFFVVSGFLMAKLYAQDPSLLAFYGRRARRLLPTYFAVILATLAICYFVVIPPDFSQAGEQAIFASGFAPNFGFWLQTNYFSKVDFNPLLHLWSLGVEIQYYLIVPLIVWAGARRRALLPALVVASLLLCLAMVEVSPKTSFFMMPLRLWEFGLGMLVARRASQEADRSPWALAGIAAILACIMLPVDGQAKSILHGHPGLAALAISLATASVLYLGVDERLLANGPGRLLKRIGDMSYSIYLVHFPIIALWFYTPFGGTRLGDGSWRAILTLVPVIFIAGAGAFFGLERRAGWLAKRSIVGCAMATTALLGLLLPRAQEQSFSPYQRAIFSASADRPRIRCGAAYPYLHPSAQFCVFKPTGMVRGTVMLLGDSHADSIKESFKREAFRRGLALAFSVSNEPMVSAGLDPDWMVSNARALGVRRIFLHFAFHNLSKPLVENVRRASARAGMETIWILPVPEAAFHIPREMYRASTTGRTMPALDRAEYRKRLASLSYLTRSGSTLKIVEPEAVLCGEKGCATADPSGRPYYYDSDHLTLLGARQLEPLFGAALGDRPAMPGGSACRRGAELSPLRIAPRRGRIAPFLKCLAAPVGSGEAFS